MPWTKAFRTGALGLAAAITAATYAFAGSPDAGERHRDHIYADSFGNLVIVSRAGYKRIVVGQGHLASELSDYTGSPASDPKVVRLHDDDTYVDCYRPPVLLKGRSYMYGLEDGEIPEPAGSCADR